MDVAQRKNIILTVVAAILFMIMVLALFFNKMMTPRYLSDIELKINGLVLIKPAIQLANNQTDNTLWLLLVHNENQTAIANQLIEALPKKIASKTQIEKNEFQTQMIDQQAIFILKPKVGLIAYLKPPFEINKMKLTYSSVFAHR